MVNLGINNGELWDKVKPYFKAVWWATLVLLLAPRKLTDFLGLTDIRSHYKGYFGAFFLLGAVQGVISYLKNWAEEKAENALNAKLKEKIIDRIVDLPADQKWVLTCCLYNESRVIYANTINPTIVSLCNQGILLPPSGLVNAVSAPYTIRECAWEYLRSNRLNYIPSENHPNYHLFVQNIRRSEFNRYLN